MTTNRQDLARIAFVVIIFSAVLLTGCASSQAKLEAFQKARGDTGFIYAQVNSVEPGINTKAACDSNWGGEKVKVTRDKICSQLEKLNVINISQMIINDVITSNEVVPNDLQIKRGAIVMIDVEKQSPFRFVEVTALEPTENCKWVGSDNQSAYDPITKAGGAVVSFIGGMLLFPAAVYFSSDRQGGVECNGWSYKTAYKDFLSKY